MSMTNLTYATTDVNELNNSKTTNLINDLRDELKEKNAELERLRQILATMRAEIRKLKDENLKLEQQADAGKSKDELIAEMQEKLDMTRVVNDCRYESFVRRADTEIRRQRAAENVEIPEGMDPESIEGLRIEAAEMLKKFRPRTLGQAGRLAGVNPSDITLLQVAMRRYREAMSAD